MGLLTKVLLRKLEEEDGALGSPEGRLLFQAAIPNRLPTNRAWPAGSSFATHLILPFRIMSELLSKNSAPTDAEIRTAMNGHICRCGTYPRLMKAIKRAALTMAGGSR